MATNHGGHKQLPWWTQPWWPQTFSEDGVTVNSPWIWRFLRRTPLVFHGFIAVAVLVYVVAVMVLALVTVVYFTQHSQNYCENYYVVFSYKWTRWWCCSLRTWMPLVSWLSTALRSVRFRLTTEPALGLRGRSLPRLSWNTHAGLSLSVPPCRLAVCLMVLPLFNPNEYNVFI